MKTVFLLSFLIAVAVAQPYASFTTWYYSGCNVTTNNYIYDLYLYPADGSCFEPSGGFPVVSSSYYYRINANSTSVVVSEYSQSDCSDIADNATYPIDACDDSSYGIVASVWTELPDDDFWGEQEYVSSGGYLWETILITNYYDALDCPDDTWVSTQVQGFQECITTTYTYCEDGKINYDYCINSDLDCSSGCTPYSETSTLDDECTASTGYTGYWSSYIDYSTSTSFQATCVGGGGSSGSTLVASFAVLFAALALVF